MKLKVSKSTDLKGKFNLPPSKAHGWRAMFIAGLAEGKSIIKSPKESGDWALAVKGLEMMGAKYKKIGDDWHVEGAGKNIHIPDDVINGGNSGPLFRYFTAIGASIAKENEYVVVTGDHSLRHIRPIGSMLDAINELGGFAASVKNDDHAPVVVGGKIKGGKCTVDGADSQLVTGLMMGAILSKNDTEIVVKNAGEKGWVNVTLDWLKRSGMEIQNVGENYDHYIIKGGKSLNPVNEKIKADWQAAPTPILMGILIPGSEIIIEDIDTDDVLPDRQVVYALKEMGANIKMDRNKVIARYSPNLKGIKIDPNWYTDQFIPIAIAAAFAEGDTQIFNNEIQRHKECDRISAVTEGLRAMGVEVIENQDGMVIKGQWGKDLIGAEIKCHNDHRMVMNFAVAGMRASGETILSDYESVTKTFANFSDKLNNLGATTEEIDE